jgi:hypothetical protein
VHKFELTFTQSRSVPPLPARVLPRRVVAHGGPALGSAGGVGQIGAPRCAQVVDKPTNLAVPAAVAVPDPFRPPSTGRVAPRSALIGAYWNLAHLSGPGAQESAALTEFPMPLTATRA